MRWLSRLKELSEAPGPPGWEDAVREIIKREVEEEADKLYEDKLGNLIAVKKGGEGRVMLAAHMDEVALMASYLEESGLIRFVSLGRVVPEQILAQRVVVHAKRELKGVVGVIPAHLADKREKLELGDLYIDVGAGSRKELEKLGVKPGSYITFDTPLAYQEETRSLMGKALDNRVGCMVLAEAFKEASPGYKLYAVFTVQEERGLRGAQPAAYHVKPDLAIAVDSTIAADTPEIPKHKAVTRLGGGPALRVMDSRLITPRKLLDFMVKVAEEAGIRYQLQLSPRSTTDASAINLAREGVPAAAVATPVRYIHAPVSLAKAEDIEETMRYVSALLEALNTHPIARSGR
ncbi:MAG: M42 family peptidase [Thermoproteota archaeon]|nr:MAG: M42 family peptidase [Candidatus Korarchaeota archaeon]